MKEIWKRWFEKTERKHVTDDPSELDAVCSRWSEKPNRRSLWDILGLADDEDLMKVSDVEDAMFEHYSRTHCVGCAYFVRLSEPFRGWGVCANGKSSRDGRVMFRDDGCDDCISYASEDEASNP